MSRVAKAPIDLPKGVKVSVAKDQISVSGPKGTLTVTLHPLVELDQQETALSVKPAVESKEGWMHAGTVRSLLNNCVVGVGQGFEKKLELVGVGYRAQAKGDVLNLALGFSHPIDYPVPAGIEITTPSQTEIVVSGFDKQKVGQVASEIRQFRPPEPYKGKGVRYAGEQLIRKEAKKK